MFVSTERVAVPPWVQEKFRAAMDKFHRREIKSWDEVFGRPLLKGKQLATEQRKLTNSPVQSTSGSMSATWPASP